MRAMNVLQNIHYSCASTAPELQTEKEARSSQPFLLMTVEKAINNQMLFSAAAARKVFIIYN
jgi:hypothetical protein